MKSKESRDGELLVVSDSRDLAVRVPEIAPTLQFAIEHWKTVSTKLSQQSDLLNSKKAENAFDLTESDLHSPLPRAYAFLDGSAYVNHVKLVRQARGAKPPETLLTDPLMYQGTSDSFLAPTQDIAVPDESWGIDFEGEIAVIVDDVPMGVSVKDAEKHIKLIMLCNDVSLRNLIPAELAKGFGFLNSKPPSAFSPFALTPDELGDSWKNSRVHLPLETQLNSTWFGSPDAGPEMHFNFCQLIAHAAKSRPLSAGTIIGSGTVSNEDRAKGSSCIAERRMIEKIDTGEIKTPFMKYGDTVTMNMFKNGKSLFGRIHQKVVPYQSS